VRGAALAAACLLALPLSCQAAEIRGARPGDFDLYLLTLSWSPGFCASGGARREPDQCASGAGFVLHGLWPQYERGYPTLCGVGAPQPSREDIALAARIFPSEGLARHEWRVHGTCSGLPPSRYFASASAARDTIKIPDAFAEARSQDDVSPRDIERAFVAANRSLLPSMMVVSCGRADDGRLVLEDVRICLDRNLKQFRPCPDEVRRQACHAFSLSVPGAGQ
jgi:ribonuclease T2